MQHQKGNIPIIVSFIIVVGLIGLAIYALMHTTEAPGPSDIPSLTSTTTGEKKIVEPSKPTQEQPKQQTKSMDTTKRLLPNFTPVAHVSKLEIIDTVVGTGAEVKPGAHVKAHYIGALASTGEVFQSSKDFGTAPIPFSLNGVIKGWTNGIPGMKIGGTRRLIIPADQAYGANPDPRSGIPANADLVFDVEMVDAQ